ncbi:MAG: signal peptidase II [Gemmataceae bacterium]|nr:signal peptidase II [Gemmataceae bacterium]
MTAADRRYRWLFWTLALTGLAADQGTKYGVFAWLYTEQITGYASGQPICDAPFVVIPDYFNLCARYTTRPWEGSGLLHFLRTISGPNVPIVNHGALFGIGGETPFGNALFTVVSLGAAAAITIYIIRPGGGRDRYLCSALGLILAGTLGNLYDRVIFGGVRDFLHFFNLSFLPFGLDNFPVFNVADCCLVCGAGLLVLEALVRKPATAGTPQATVSAAPAEAPGAHESATAGASTH